MIVFHAGLIAGRLFVQAEFAGKKTGDKMLVMHFSEFRFSSTANVFGKQTARVKAATRRGIDGAGDIAF